MKLRIMRSFVKIKPSQIGEITLSFTDGKPCPSREFLTWLICLKCIYENKILAKNSEFTVSRGARGLNFGWSLYLFPYS